ncbi:hypothetical protein [Burkholderia gladioli]|uniref:hypothetical protein n=1 Tax=Burkholderia gladioli TaxID=28095 RepID=UPI000CFEDB13|nr:hypothetical protein [Burkholderia gladioli]MBU9272712.1 hypothetical protein [Burkholderia gladioli]
MAKILVDEAVLIDLAAKFHRASALFDVIEDEVQREERACQLAVIGVFIMDAAAGEVEALYLGRETCHD